MHGRAARLGEMLYGAVRPASVLLDGSHVSVDSDHLLWLTAVLQQSERLLTQA